jgi:hypothetical protein
MTNGVIRFTAEECAEIDSWEISKSEASRHWTGDDDPAKRKAALKTWCYSDNPILRKWAACILWHLERQFDD